MIRILDKIALSGMALGLVLLLFPLTRLAEWAARTEALAALGRIAAAVNTPLTFKLGFFVTLITTILHIFTSHLVKPKEPAA